MDSKDVLVFGSARAYRLAEEDENTRLMYQLNCKDGSTPFCLPGTCPLDAIEDVAMGRGEGAIMFWPMSHIIEIGLLEWSLDGNLRLWREARAYADQFEQQGRLISSWDHWVIKYSRA